MQLESSTPIEGRLYGRQILVIEDEYFLADDIARELRCCGANVLGPYGDVAEAMELLRSGASVDAAVLDVNLQGEMIYTFASKLLLRDIPLLFATGYDKDALPAEFRDVDLIGKPADAAAVAKALDQVIARHWRGRSATRA